ncbi:putative ubiquitin protein ligase neurlb; neurali zed family protein [Trichuris trichiura]|uniref:Putative ubiquitin protein ligase neurlb neurali zed family protein n=1 Tax=Trichuris trichiura TaxID=36087 RepID=A0A077Z2K6_TRITR|nr:putative ubiquitin protein ligase neurlb; neurali zed family protein [Trichuris trichiura]
MSFHRVHGSNIRLYSNGIIARREQSFCKALSFSSRPIRRNEKFGFRIIECDDEWSGALRIGITNLNPLDIRNDLPKYACPDLINTQRSWAKGVGERYCKKGNYFTFSVNASGEMMFSVNGHPRGMFLTGINLNGLTLVNTDFQKAKTGLAPPICLEWHARALFRTLVNKAPA